MNVVDTSLCSSLAGCRRQELQSKGEGKEGAGPKKTLIWTLYYKLHLKLKHTDRDTDTKGVIKLNKHTYPFIMSAHFFICLHTSEGAKKRTAHPVMSDRHF